MEIHHWPNKQGTRSESHWPISWRDCCSDEYQKNFSFESWILNSFSQCFLDRTHSM